MTILSKLTPPENILLRLIYFSTLFCIIMFLSFISMRLYTLTRSLYLRTDLVVQSKAIHAIREHYPLIEYPKSNQWLWNHFEAGQSIHQYQNYVLSNPLPSDAKIYLMKLLGENQIDESLFELTRKYLELYFCMPAFSISTGNSLKLPIDATREHPETGIQLNAEYLLHEILIPLRPKDAAGLLALTAQDLWPGNDWSFIFGKASLYERVGVWSIARFHKKIDSDTTSATLLRRTLKTASHEFGHILGMKHCISYQCNMNGSNHLEEADSQPLTLCPHCLQKLLVHQHCDLKKRMNGLHAFFLEHEIDSNAQDQLKNVIDSLHESTESPLPIS